MTRRVQRLLQRLGRWAGQRPGLASLFPFAPERESAGDELLVGTGPSSPAHDETLARPGLKGLRRLLIALAVLGGLAAAWHFTPLKHMGDLRVVLHWALGFRHSPFAPIYILGAFLAAGLTGFPPTVLVVLSGILFGPFRGFAYALCSSLASATLLYFVGGALGRKAVHRWSGPYVTYFKARMARRGMLTMMLVSLLPLAPFSVIYLVAGASNIRFRDFLLGTIMGMAPGMLPVIVFGDRLVRLLREPNAVDLIVLVSAGLLVVAIGFAASAWAIRRRHLNAHPQGPCNSR